MLLGTSIDIDVDIDTLYCRRQLERDHEGHAAGGVRPRRGVPPELLHPQAHRLPLLRGLRPRRPGEHVKLSK